MKPSSVPRLLLELLLLAWSSSLWAFSTGEASYTPHHWQTDDGLPHNVIQAVSQTADGFLWVGTQAGLARFDGVEFEVIPIEAAPVKTPPITALWGDREGGLWIGTASHGLYYLQEGRFAAYTNAPTGPIRCLRRDRNGVLWVGGQKGLWRLKENVLLRFDDFPLLATNIIRSLTEDAQGRLWVAHAYGLASIEGGQVQTNISSNEIQTHQMLRAALKDRGETLWFGTGSGLYCRTNGQWVQYTKKDGLPDAIISAIYEDRRGSLWVGTLGGLARKAGDKFVVATKPGADSYDQVFCFWEDFEGNLWVGAKDGLYRLNSPRCVTYTRRDGLAHDNIISVMADRKGDLWAGSWGGGLQQFHNGEATCYDRARVKLMKNDLVLAIAERWDGAIWFGLDYSGGLYRLDGNKVRWSYFGTANGLPSAAIRFLFEENRRRFWVGTSAGLYVLEGPRFRRCALTGQANDLPLRCMLKGRDGALWIGTEQGLVRWDAKATNLWTTAQGLSDNMVLALHEDAATNLWIGTANGGLNRLTRIPAAHHSMSNAQAFSVAAYTTRNGLFDNTVLEILETENGFLWMSSYRGIFCAKRDWLRDYDLGRTPAVRCVSLGKEDGMESAICVGAAKPAGCVGADGRLWFPTTKGLVAVNGRLELNERPPPVAIREVIADNKKTELTRRKREAGAKATDPPALNSVIIPPGQGELEFRYAAMSYCAPEKNRFKYKLEGLDADWIQAGTRRAAFYSRVPPGHYTFRVAACNNDGVWNESGAATTVTLRSHFWQTTWFIGLIALTTIAGVAGLARYVTWKNMRRKLAALEQQHAIEEERARIARDMHDNLGAQLTEIMLLSDLATSPNAAQSSEKHVKKIASVAREVVRNLDAIVWAVNPENDSFDKLAGYIQEYADLYFAASPIRCWVDIPAGLPNFIVSSEIRHNVFLTVKEALNNVLKHSEAATVWIRFQVADSIPSITIEDNGKGFLADDASAFGNGLKNMRKRMKHIGGDFILTSEPGKGTRLQLLIPIKPI